MLQKLIALFAILALSAAFAGTVPAPGSGSYTITLTQPSMMGGNQLRPGDYRLTIAPDKITVARGKTVFEVKGTVEVAEQKFPSTAIRYSESGGQPVITEICIGGTKTKLRVQ